MAKEKRNATTAWLERSNPLRGLTIAQANMIFDCARNGDTQRLHWMYQEIETQNPVLSMATTRRAGAAANFAWRIAERAAMDGSLSAEQKDAAERFFGDIDNLSDLFEHLDLALFRGFAHAQPIWEDDRTVRHIELIDSWKFLKKDGEWFFNPVCDGFSSNCVSCRDARLVTVERRRPVDVPALAIHLRAAVGSRDWGRFIERYALPKPAVVMAQNATEADRDKYLESASALENGQVTVWPSGASLMDFAGSSRGVDPFTAFILHQEKTILMLATGGTLGSMAESGAGTLAGNAQADVWDQIVSRDAGIIAQAIRRAMLRPFLAAAFPGQPVAVDFDFDLTKKPTPKEIFETATAAKNAGYLVDRATLEEETGWKLEKAPESPSPVPGFAMNSQPKPKTPFKNAANGLQNAPRGADGQGDPSAKPPAQRAENAPSGAADILKAFAKDTGPAAEAVKELLDDPSAEAAADLTARLPDLLPTDPEMASILADAMARAMAEAAAGEMGGEVKNSIANPCPRCHRNMPKGGVCSFCAKRAENMKKVAGLVDELAKKSPDGKKPGWAHKEETLGEVDAKTAAAISAAMPEIQAEGQAFEVDTTQLQHALNDHGVGRETNENQIPITPDDLRKIPDVLSDYDEIVPGKGVKDGKKNNAVIFKKKFKDGTLACVEIDQYSEKRKSRILRFKTMWKEKIL